jgi:FXSXX-COOH protein
MRRNFLFRLHALKLLRVAMRVKSCRQHRNGAWYLCWTERCKQHQGRPHMTFQTSASFAAAKKNRVPLAQIDVRGADAARKLARVLPVSADRTARTSTFNSAL